MSLRLVLFGAPGAGKGTQAVFLKKQFGLEHISTGNIFRKAMEDNTFLGKQVRQYMDAGLLVPDEIVIDLVQQELQENIKNKGFVFDGFPRTLPQAVKFGNILSQMSFHLDAVLSLEVSIEVLIHRISGRRLCLQCGALYHVDTLFNHGQCTKDGSELVQRKDDEEAAVKIRLDAFEKLTLPLKEYYKSLNLLVEVNGFGTPEEVFGRMLESLKKA